MRALLPLLLLAACHQEPDFDQRYAETQKQLEKKAAEIDRAVSAAPAPPHRDAAPPPSPAR